MIRVLYIIDTLGPGGKERQLVEILRGLDKNLIKPSVVTFNPGEFYAGLVRELTETFIELEKKNKLKPAFLMSSIIEKLKPNIIHTFDALSSFYAYLPAKKYRVNVLNNSIQDAGVDKGWEYKFKRFFLKKANLVLANSFTGLKYYRVKGEVIYNLIDLNRFVPYGESEEFNIIMVANFTPYKDYDTFLKAARMLVTEGIVGKVFMVGAGVSFEKYKKEIESYDEVKNRFVLAGMVNNVEKYLSLCKIGILCSTPKFKEGISNSILEYMAAGLVPIATNIGGTPEIIENGKNGFLIEPRDYESIYIKVKQLKENNDLRKNIVSEAKKTILEKFNYSKNLSKLIEIYLRLSEQKL
ncbi:MAG: glycosyltransferase family 4 protein [Ignavibacteria bacterium]